ncbi:MAG: hypothetical protein N2171_02200, partial [Clostridia bacterium]|nr:hypothetical protein [Clostridia bacterium]
MKKIAAAATVLSIVAAMSVTALASTTSTSSSGQGMPPMSQCQGRGGQKGGLGKMMLMNWTVDELKSYLAMSEDERAAYLEEKKAEIKAKRAEMASQDKTELTDEEKAAKKAEM